MKIGKKKEGINIDNFKDQRNQVKYQRKYKKDWKKKESQDPGEVWKKY